MRGLWCQSFRELVVIPLMFALLPAARYGSLRIFLPQLVAYILGRAKHIMAREISTYGLIAITKRP